MSRQLHFFYSIFFLAITLISQLGHSGIEGESFRVELVKTGYERNGEFFPALDKTLATASDNDIPIAPGASFDTYKVRVHNATGHPAIGILQTGSDQLRDFTLLPPGNFEIKHPSYDRSRFMIIGKEDAERMHSGSGPAHFDQQSEYVLMIIIGLAQSEIRKKTQDTHQTGSTTEPYRPEQNFRSTQGHYVARGTTRSTALLFGGGGGITHFSGSHNQGGPIEIYESQSEPTAKSTLGQSQSSEETLHFTFLEDFTKNPKGLTVAKNYEVYKRAIQIKVNENNTHHSGPFRKADELSLACVADFHLSETLKSFEANAGNSQKGSNKYDFNR